MIWKDIPGYEDLYQINNLGFVRSLRTSKKKIVKRGIYHQQYCFVKLYNLDNILSHWPNKELMLMTFLGYNKESLRDVTIENKDGNILNNKIDNLNIKKI